MKGVDPRHWDLHQMLAAYEVTLQRGCKDEAAWNRMRTQLYAEPAEVKKSRLATPRGAKAPPPRGAMTVDSVEAMLAAASARDAQYGAT